MFAQRADFAVADITVTDIRKKFVDFTEPFMETSIVVLIHKKYANNITSFRDLTQQTDIKYGTFKNGTTYLLFQYSTDPTLQEMYRQMNTNPEGFVHPKNSKEGIKRVKTTPYAFIVEKTLADKITGQECDLTYIEDQNNLINPRQFAIALPKGSPHLETFNSAIRQLKSVGGVDRIRDRYRRKCGFLKGVTINVSLKKIIEINEFNK